MTILLGWKWAPLDGGRDLYRAVDGFQAWDARPATGEVPWPSVAQFIAANVPDPSVQRFDPSALISECTRRLGRPTLEPGGRVALTVVTDEAGAGLGVQLELASGHAASVMPRLTAAFADTQLVLYSPADDTLHSRGAVDSSLLSAAAGHVFQPSWGDVTEALRQLDTTATIVFENHRGDFVRLRGTRAGATVDCHIAGDSVELARASRDGNERLDLDAAFTLFKTFFDSGERSPWFTWRPA